MEHLNLFLIQLAVIALPGIIWARLATRFAAREVTSELDFLVSVFVYGLASYAVTFVVYLWLREPFPLIDLQRAPDKNVLTADVAWLILRATLAGLVLGLAWVYISNHKLLTRVLQFIRATKRYGDEDVWDYTFNSPRAAVEYVHFRDFPNKLVFAGWVNTFSESGELRELVLRDVQVYDFEGQFMYAVPLLYLARKPEDVHIEFPHP